MHVGLTRTDLDLAVARLIATKPFYGSLLSRFRRCHDPHQRGALGYRFESTGRPVLTWNGNDMIVPLDGSKDPDAAEGVRAWTDSELDGSLEKVCVHVLHKHHDRRGAHGMAKWGLACDLAVNGLIVNLPCTAVLPGDLDLPPDLAAEQYAEMLPHEDDCAACGRPPSIPSPGADGEPDEQEEGNQSNGPAQDGDEESDTPSSESAGTDGDQVDRQDEEQNPSVESGDGSDSSNCPACSQPRVMDHQPWGEEDNAPPDISNSVVQRMVQHAVAQAESHGKGIGDLPGHVKSLIDDIQAGPPQHWGPKLRRFTQGNRKSGKRPTRMRRHRRYGPFFSGQRRKRMGRVVIIADTSASVDRDGLAQEWAEMRAIARQADAVVMEVDAAVQDIYALTPTTPVPAFKGRGGTRFRLALELVADPGSRDVHPRQQLLRGAEAVILLTDGGVNDLPRECPIALPVMWAILPGGVVPYAWGDVIHLHGAVDAP